MSNKPTSDKKRDKYGVTAENWHRLDAMTDEEITAAALADPDNPPLTDEQLAQFRRPAPARQIRHKLGMRRETFAAAYGIPLQTLRAWERHEAEPTEGRDRLSAVDRARAGDRKSTSRVARSLRGTSMRTRGMLVLTCALGATVAFAQSHQHGNHKGAAQPYAGQQTRAVASLSDEEVRGFLDGRGMGLAKSAELNGHPGPMHVLELAEELRLTPEQRDRVKAAFDSMKTKARKLGEAYIAAERAVDQAFTSGTADAAEVATRVAEANRLLGEVRLAHLAAHVEITPVLTPEQRARYAELRGYGTHAGHEKHKH